MKLPYINPCCEICQRWGVVLGYQDNDIWKVCAQGSPMLYSHKAYRCDHFVRDRDKARAVAIARVEAAVAHDEDAKEGAA